MQGESRLKLIFHIGMGKTGTTSIQRALKESRSFLEGERTKYLGMWFDMLSDTYQGLSGEQVLFRESIEEKQKVAHKLVAHLQDLNAANGYTNFVMSNESFFTAGKLLKPIFDILIQNFEVKFVVYIRNPRKWLPSAYAQWGISHKTKRGALKSFAELAPELLLQYQAIFFWHENYHEEIKVISYEDVDSVVSDFGECIGVVLNEKNGRQLKRNDKAELVLRAFFNSQFEEEVLPNKFEKAVQAAALSNVPSISAIINESFNCSNSHSYYGEIANVEELLETVFDITFDQDIKSEVKSDGDVLDLRNRVLDYVIKIVFEQSLRISALEDELRGEKN